MRKKQINISMGEKEVEELNTINKKHFDSALSLTKVVKYIVEKFIAGNKQ